MGYYFYYNFLYVWIGFRRAHAATSAMKTLIVMPRPLFQTSVYEYQEFGGKINGHENREN